MDYNKINAISNIMLGFSSFIGILIAMLFYIYQIKKMGVIEALLYAIIYIDIYLLFLYIIRRNLK